MMPYNAFLMTLSEYIDEQGPNPESNRFGWKGQGVLRGGLVRDNKTPNIQ